MSYGYLLFRGSGPPPTTQEEIDPTRLRPFASFDEVKALLSQFCPTIVWNTQHQTGRIDNEIGYFEFHCYASIIADGVVGLSTSYRQSVETSHRYIIELCRATGLYAFDKQTLQILA
jgi:hypothetical protein